MSMGGGCEGGIVWGWSGRNWGRDGNKVCVMVMGISEK